MVNVLFRQSEVEDPYAFYAQMVSEQPIYFDSANKIWAVYSYTACQRMLKAEFAYIPDPNQAVKAQLSASARLIAEHVIRLQNPPQHGITRPVVLPLFEQVRPVNTPALLDAIFANQECSFDWVTVIAKRLPTQALLVSFGFVPETAERLLSLLDVLVKIMLSGKSEDMLQIVNSAADEAYPLVEQHIIRTPNLWSLVENESKHEAVLQVMTANLIGLLIQSYDAGRGILSNTLLQYSRQAKSGSGYNNLVVETLRYDPPVHNTRRILAHPCVTSEPVRHEMA